LNASGKAFKDMDRRRQRQIATILSTDVPTILKMQNGELDKQIGIKKELNVEDKYMKKLAEESTPVMLQLKAAFQEFAIALVPIIKAFRAVVGAFAKFPAWVKWLIAGIPILGMVFFLFVKPLIAIGTAGKVAAGGAMTAGKGIGSGAMLAGKGIGKGGMIAAKGAFGWLMIAGVFLLVAAGVAAIILSFAELAKVGGPHTLEAAGAISMLLGVMVAMIAIAGVAGAFPPAAVAITIGLGLIAIASLILIAIIKAMVPALDALAVVFSSIAKVGSADPFVEWIAGLYRFAKAVQNVMPKMEGFKTLLLQMNRAWGVSIKTTSEQERRVNEIKETTASGTLTGSEVLESLRVQIPGAATAGVVGAASIVPTPGTPGPSPAAAAPVDASRAVTTTVQTTIVKAQVLEMKGADNSAIVQEIKALGEKIINAMVSEPITYNFEGKINENVLVSFINKHAKEATRMRRGMWNHHSRR